MKKKYVKNTVILSGDNEKSVQETAFKIGVGKYYSELLPADKVEITEKLINQIKKLTENQKLLILQSIV